MRPTLPSGGLPPSPRSPRKNVHKPFRKTWTLRHSRPQCTPHLEDDEGVKQGDLEEAGGGLRVRRRGHEVHERHAEGRPGEGAPQRPICGDRPPRSHHQKHAAQNKEDWREGKRGRERASVGHFFFLNKGILIEQPRGAPRTVLPPQPGGGLVRMPLPR